MTHRQTNEAMLTGIRAGDKATVTELILANAGLVVYKEEKNGGVLRP